MSKSARNAPKPKPAKPAVTPAILDRRAKPLKKWEDEIVTPRLEELELRDDRIEGELAGLHAVRDGDPVLAYNALAEGEVVVALRGGYAEDRRRLLVELAEMDRGAHDPGAAARKRNADELAKVKRQIENIDAQIKKLVAEKEIIKGDIKRIRRALRRYGNIPCILRAAENVRPSIETLAADVKSRAKFIDEKTAFEEGDKSEEEGVTVINESVDRVARKAKIDLSAALDVNSDIRDIRLLNISQHDSEANRLAERVPAFELICLLFPEQVKAHCKARLAKYHKENGPVLSADQRAAKIAQLRKKISELDWAIIGQVNALRAVGKPASYPKNISVWALLGLQPQKEVRQFHDRLGREEEL